MSREGRRALSLAYELSLAVRQQTTSDIRATLSAPEGSIQSSPLGALTTLAEHKDAWKVVRRGKEELEVPLTKVRPGSGASSAILADTPPRQPSRRRSPVHSSPGTPKTEETPQELPSAQQLQPTCEPSAQNAALNPSSSLLSFVRRFSGSRFLRDLTNSMADSPGPGLGLPALPALGLSALRLKDSRSLSLQLESRQVAEQAHPGLQRSTLALPRVELDRASGLTPLRSNVMKVFSKGILSESSVDFSTTSIQDAGRSHALSGGHEAAVSTQDVAGLLRPSPKTTTAATSTAESELPAGVLSSMNLSAHRDLVELLRQDVVPITTSRGLTANMSEEGIPRPVVDDEHKSLFDLKKSLLTSIPEAASPDEDVPH
ncbi:uncharacterized protein LOC127749327 [Frankliniella occidentalis]|uniref:Uncharacterized protein LOC127749327 n=1 Tax=Frankliniella occidentalis TaxID=133901 RepID=A0A9C6U7U6_FRAOC|nr:uncharacterized protein LOC127749327 [Frankliniella occidentalis]